MSALNPSRGPARPSAGGVPSITEVGRPLPDHVYIKRPTATFSSHFYFAVRDGQIWMRANEEVTGVKEPWRLLGARGLPTNDTANSRFELPVRIEEIVTDADELIALSDAQHFYLIRFDNLSSIGTDLWRDGDGAPGGPLLLDARHRRNRGFSMGRRNQDVLYWRDPAGNPHSWGLEGITTLYLLCENGREITIFDTGLQPNFGRHIPTPERGGFVAESISASASTVFLIDRHGRMYTRLCDFDTLGSNPMFFNYSYSDAKRDADRGDDVETLYTSIKLPPEEWRRQPGIRLTGDARISRDITILQNGRGNHARELRVAGTDEERRLGYYWKPIAGAVWDFRVTGHEVEATHFLDPAEASRDPVPAEPSYDRRYLGKVTAGPHQLDAELVDFNLFSSPARLVVGDGDHRLELALHTTDAWTYATREDPGRDGTPLVFYAAIGLPDGQVATPSSAGLSELRSRLQARNLSPFAFLVRASLNYFELVPNFRFGPIKAELTFVDSGYPSVAAARAGEAVVRAGFGRQAELDYLQVADLDSMPRSPGTTDVRWQKLRLNRYALEQLAAQRRALTSSARNQAALAWAFTLVNVVLHVIPIAYLPRLRNIFASVGGLLHAQALTSNDLVQDTRGDYDAAGQVLEARIDLLQNSLGPAPGSRPRRRVFRRWRRLGR